MNMRDLLQLIGSFEVRVDGHDDVFRIIGISNIDTANGFDSYLKLRSSDPNTDAIEVGLLLCTVTLPRIDVSPNTWIDQAFAHLGRVRDELTASEVATIQNFLAPQDEVDDDIHSKVVIDTCNFGHKFATLPDHPVSVSGRARCPHCLATGYDMLSKDFDCLPLDTQSQIAVHEIRQTLEQMFQHRAAICSNGVESLSLSGNKLVSQSDITVASIPMWVNEGLHTGKFFIQAFNALPRLLALANTADKAQL